MTLLATYIALAILAGLVIFQILLISGKPWGHYAWGGQHKVLPKKFRYASYVSILSYIIFACFLVSKAGIIEIVSNPTILNVGMWVISLYFAFGVLLNLLSHSKKERAVMTPIAALLAVTFLIVTLA